MALQPYGVATGKAVVTKTPSQVEGNNENKNKMKTGEIKKEF